MELCMRAPHCLQKYFQEILTTCHLVLPITVLRMLNKDGIVDPSLKFSLQLKDVPKPKVCLQAECLGDCRVNCLKAMTFHRIQTLHDLLYLMLTQ